MEWSRRRSWRRPLASEACAMATKKIFLASSAELKADRDAFELYVGRRNKDWKDTGVFLEVVRWEEFLDAMSKTRKQDEYNEAIRGCDVFVILLFDEGGQVHRGGVRRRASGSSSNRAGR